MNRNLKARSRRHEQGFRFALAALVVLLVHFSFGPALAQVSSGGDTDKTATANGDGLEIFGTIKNNSPHNITSPSLKGMIYGSDGGLMATNEGAINVGMIPAGKTANFRAAFPGVHDFSAAKFDAQGRGFRAPAPEGGGEGAAPPEPEAPEEEGPPAE